MEKVRYIPDVVRFIHPVQIKYSRLKLAATLQLVQQIHPVKAILKYSACFALVLSIERSF